MPTVRYRLVNVFAETPFGGNPLAVIEDASMLRDAEMQLVARLFNLSETTFILPSDHAAARIRIFTPTYEMPFAGHPTLKGGGQVRRSDITELFPPVLVVSIPKKTLTRSRPDSSKMSDRRN